MTSRIFSKGFTLIETIVTLVLLAILATFAVSRWSTSPQLDAELQQVLGDIRYTQTLAMSHGQRFRINFTLPSSYTITTIAGTAVNNPSTGATSVTLTPSVTITSVTNLPNNLISFDERGIPYTDSAATVALAANATITFTADGITRKIVITPTTGVATAQ